jgi:hypothetical protein
MARARQTLRDMALSLGLMAVVIAGLLFIGPARALVLPGAHRMAAVDYADVAKGFGTVTHHAAVVPVRLPASWRANAARLTRATGAIGTCLHIGWATPGSLFAGLDECDGAPDRLVHSVLGSRGAAVRGTRGIGGSEWQTRVSQRGEQAVTRSFGAVFVVVTGSATDAQLSLLASSLR